MELDATAPVDGFEYAAPSLRELPHNAADRTQKFVTFFIGDRHYALHSSAVSEVTSKLKSVPLPDSPETLIGIAPLRGEIVAVIDPGACPAQTTAISADKQKTVVLKQFDPEGEMPIAFNVDRLGEFVSIDLESVKPLADDSEPLAALEASTPNGTIRIVEPSRLTAALHR